MANDITRDDIDELLSFLPAFEEPGRRFGRDWESGSPGGNGGSKPTYEEDIVRFFHLAGKPCWSDFEYDPTVVVGLIGDEEHVANASLSEVKTLLTWCARGERFHEGHWSTVLETGRIQAVLRRLRELRDTIE